MINHWQATNHEFLGIRGKEALCHRAGVDRNGAAGRTGHDHFVSSVLELIVRNCHFFDPEPGGMPLEIRGGCGYYNYLRHDQASE